jgi:hypothetical protein
LRLREETGKYGALAVFQPLAQVLHDFCAAFLIYVVGYDDIEVVLLESQDSLFFWVVGCEDGRRFEVMVQRTAPLWDAGTGA